MLTVVPENGLVRDAADEAAFYLAQGRASVDEVFGKGYAAQHPELVAAFMRAAATNYHAACLAAALRKTAPPMRFA